MQGLTLTLTRISGAMWRNSLLEKLAAYLREQNKKKSLVVAKISPVGSLC